MEVHPASEAERIVVLEVGHKELKSDLLEIKESLKDIATEIRSRPSWAVARYITVVTSVCMALIGGIITYVATHAH